jgi:long-chain fatty acid transport protein
VFNPGGIAVAEGTNVQIGGSLYIAEGSYQPDGGAKVKTDSDPSVVPSFYLTSRVHDAVAVGIGFHMPFGLAVSWPANHAQAPVIEDQKLRTYFITPSIGFNLNKQVPGLSIGGGVDIVPATVELQQDLLFGPERGTAHLGGEATGVGGRVGVMYNPGKHKALKLGVMWRSKVKLDFEGQADFDIVDPYRQQLPPDGDITTSITLPQSVWGGIAYAASPQLELEYNAVWIGWKSFDELRINLPDNADGTPAVTVSPQEYRNTVTHRLGLEYSLPAQRAALRAGFIIDPTPIPASTLSARLPDIDRKNITLGASKYFGDWGAHLGLLWVTPDRRDADNLSNSRYGVQAFVTSLMISGQFGGGSTKPSAATTETTVSRR